MYFLFHNLFALSIFLFSPSAEFFIWTQNCSFLETLCGSFQIFLIVCIPCWCFKLIFYLVKHIKHIYFLFSIWYLFSIFSLWGSHSVRVITCWFSQSGYWDWIWATKYFSRVNSCEEQGDEVILLCRLHVNISWQDKGLRTDTVHWSWLERNGWVFIPTPCSVTNYKLPQEGRGLSNRLLSEAVLQSEKNHLLNLFCSWIAQPSLREFWASPFRQSQLFCVVFTHVT